MPGTLGHKIIALFRKGMAFGLYVLKSDYKGSINGLPGGIPYNAASARPVYLLLVFQMTFAKEVRDRDFVFEELSLLDRVTI